MPISFPCSCGKTLQVKDEFAGRRVKCPACAGIATAPAAEPQFEVVEDAPPVPVARPRAKPVEDERSPYKVKPARKNDDDDEDDEDRPRSKRRRDDDDEEEERPCKKKRKRDDDDDRARKKKKRRAAAASGNSSNRVGYMIGGLFCVVLGLVIAYFAHESDDRRSTGRMVGGIAMAVFGLGSAVRGLTGNVPDDDEE